MKQTGLVRIHVDTDFAGDPDDACALAMVLGWPGAELVGVTTTADPDGRRASYVRRLLEMLGKRGVPVLAGAGESTTTGRPMGDTADHGKFWGGAPPPSVVGRPPVADALDLIRNSLVSGATVAAIGPYTNLALLERSRPGALSDARVVTMGGWVFPLGDGYPRWGAERDWNVACDTNAALTLFESGAALTFVPCAAAASAVLRAADLPRLVASGPVGALLARQTIVHGENGGYAALGRAHSALPDDLVNFHWDPVACAAALGWSGVSVEDIELRPVLANRVLRFEVHPGGRRTSVAASVHGAEFAEVWLTAVEKAQT